MVFLGLGCNLGDRVDTLSKALEKLSEFGEVEAVSKTYESESWGYEDELSYLNLVCGFRTALSPTQLLQSTLQIERALGRERNKRKEGEPYRPRFIDIDILFFDDLTLNSPDLTIPHPQLHLRNFVLKPMTDIAQNFVHPVLNKKMIELYSSSPDTSSLEAIN